MRVKLLIFLSVLLGLVPLGQAQSFHPIGTPICPPTTSPANYGGYPYGYWGSSTALEGFGRGLGDMINAFGQYNLATSAAAVNLSQARRSEIANDKLWTQTYFEMRDLNRQNREAEIKRERGNPEDWARYAQAGKPKPLGNQNLDAATGQIRWPVLLGLHDFAAQMRKIGEGLRRRRLSRRDGA